MQKKKNKKNYNNRFKELKYIQHTYKLKQFCFIIINKYSIYSFFFLFDTFSLGRILASLKDIKFGNFNLITKLS